MEQPSYESVQPLIADAQQQGAQMVCTFRCPVTGAELQARGKLQKGAGSQAADRAKKSVTRGLKWKLARAIRSALGYGMAGQVAGDVAGGMMNGGGSQTSYSDGEKQAAIVDAFESVSDRFLWDAAGNRWISMQAARDLMPDFTRLLQEAPVTQPYDRKVLARMMCEIACADGQVDDSERSFLGSFISPDLGAVNELLGAPRLSPAELAETSRSPGREVMLMLAAAVAYADHDVDASEVERLRELAAGLEIADARADELAQYARAYLVDQQLAGAYAGDQRDPAAHGAAMELAQRLGLDPTLAERIDIRVRKRLGIN